MRAFPIPVTDVHEVLKAVTHTADVITRNYLHAQSQSQSAVYPSVSYGAMSPGIFVKENVRLLPAIFAKGKQCWMSELQAGQRALKGWCQLSLTLGNAPYV